MIMTTNFNLRKRKLFRHLINNDFVRFSKSTKERMNIKNNITVCKFTI